MKNIINALLGLLYPQKCINCGIKITEPLLCSKCKESLQFISSYCDICGTPKEKEERCELCNRVELNFVKARSLYRFNPIIQKVIHKMKYEENLSAAKLLAKKSHIYLSTHNDFPTFDYLIPVPLHRIKKKERGFNQAERLAYYLSKYSGISLLSNLVKRNRFTITQTRLNRKERQANVKDAFILKKSKINKSANILLVDDVFTTGATMNTISKLLKSNGFTRIYVLTIARA